MLAGASKANGTRRLIAQRFPAPRSSLPMSYFFFPANWYCVNGERAPAMLTLIK